MQWITFGAHANLSASLDKSTKASEIPLNQIAKCEYYVIRVSILKVMRMCLSQNPYFCSVPQTLGSYDASMSPTSMMQNFTFWSHKMSYDLVDVGRGGDPQRKNTLRNRPSHRTGSRHWSVVSCVRCGWVVAGLGFPVGVLRFAPVFTPNLKLNCKLLIF